jgi:hypothetical protein
MPRLGTRISVNPPRLARRWKRLLRYFWLLGRLSPGQLRLSLQRLFLPFAGILTLVLGIVYVGGAWTPSHYGAALQKIGIEQFGPTLGRAREVRGDEWAVLTPYFQIAVQNGLGERNSTSPYHESLRSFYALPTRDWSIIVKPQLWGFLIAAPESAYSFYHFILMGSLIWGFTILFRQVGIDLHWAVLGALLIFFSRFVQVWWTSIGPTFAFAAWPLVAALAPGPRWRRFILAFYAAAVWLFSLLYIPFIIGGAFAFGGLLVALRRDALKAAVLVPAAGGVVAAVILLAWYYADLIPIMQNTVYPGARASHGGNVHWLQVLSHIFPYIAAVQFEPTIPDMNECEIGTLSSYLPLLIATFVDHGMLLQQLRTHWWTVGAFSLTILLVLAWLVLPIPPEIGQIFLWHRVPPWRLLWAFGLLTTFASVWLASIATWRISIARAAMFLVITSAVWIGTKNAVFESWFDGVILVTVGLATAIAAIRSAIKTSDQRGVLLFGAAVLTSALTFGTFNPLQSARPIFHPPVSPLIEGLQRLALAHPHGWIAASGSYGAILAGLGLRSVNHALLRPELDFYRPIFSEMEPGEFNTVFNRYMHADLAAVGRPRVLDVNRDDHVLVPMVDLGTPLPATAVTNPTTSHSGYGGQIETARWELDRNSWKLLLVGWVPFGDLVSGQALEIWIPKELAQLRTSVRAVRNYRPDLTAATVGSDFRMGGFIAELEGLGRPPRKLSQMVRVLSRVQDGSRFEARPAPTDQVRPVPSKAELVDLPLRGSVDAVALEEGGYVIEAYGWVVLPDRNPDEIAFFSDIPNVGAELLWINRPDVVHAGAASDPFVGFKIRMNLGKPLQALPAGASLCVAASSEGKLVARMSNHSSVPCR